MAAASAAGGIARAAWPAHVIGMAGLPGPHTLAALHGATAAWVLAFVLYLWRFAPLLVRPRLRAPTAAATPVRSRP
ncbi:Uncharacterised protein [Bordetella pertussis]|nr:Uncharacterised protein [Bordetella pertussis]